ncbi:MAG: PBSX family phage terminase large subunit [Tissierellales bacterium]|nr:PBSX family phage terminase large subunit [Tissierellales bacterium]
MKVVSSMTRKGVKQAPFKWAPFSRKQKQVLSWWMDGSPMKNKDGVVCDGSVRAGKTIIMSFSYILWAMEYFNFQNFIMAGKTIGSFRRNVLFLLKIILRLRGFKIKDHRSDNMLMVRDRRNGKVNYFYIFGGKDESSQDLIQGLTAAGSFFDEVTLMPQSFVNQAVARCSVTGAKLWFNCNPDGPYHWFYLEYLLKLKEKNLFNLHFTMDDNPSLTEEVKERYKRMFSGIFYKRYILGLWVVAEGIIYDMFSRSRHIVDALKYTFEKYYVSVDYGTQNATVFLLWGLRNGKWYCIKEYYYSGRDTGIQKTDSQYSNDLKEFLGTIKVTAIIVDPSAASFIAQLKKDGFKVKKAKNDVVDGIRHVSNLLSESKIFFDKRLRNTLKEFASYIWDEKAADNGEDKPIKQMDHAMDAVRYFCYTIIKVKGIRKNYSRR